MARLITHSGDMGDVDGFYALAQYARTGADVLFILNYPAYFNVKYTEPEHENEFGLGYTYSTNRLLQITKLRFSHTEAYQPYDMVLKRFGLVDLMQDVTFKFKQIYTLLALVMCHEVWNACPAVISEGGVNKSKGRFHFCVGGVNTIDPFHIGEVNNEVFLYADVLKKVKIEEDPIINDGVIMNSNGSTSGETISTLLAACTEIYMDFNGSMAFLTPKWKSLIEGACRETKVKGAFIQGGVYSYTPARTIPKRENIINRLSCATMNQLYCPRGSLLFFKLMRDNGIRMYIVANNDIESLEDYHLFFATNKISHAPLVKYAEIFYNSRVQVRVKPYDFYVALVVSMAIKDAESLFRKTVGHKLVYNSIYAATLLSKDAEYDTTAMIEFVTNTDTYVRNGDDMLKIQDKVMLLSEFEILTKCDWTMYDVRALSFKLDKQTMLLTIESRQ
jgi:hypothetical protein